MSTAIYPQVAGFKREGTSQEAAQAIAPKAITLRERVLASIKLAPGTPEQIADRLHVPVMNIRPRCSELFAKGLIEDSGRRDAAQGGRRAIVWKAVA